MKQFLKLLADNRNRGIFRAQYPIEAKAGDEATIYLYDSVVSDELTAEYWGGVSPQSFVKTLAEIKTEVIHLRINSPGGDVFAARAIEQALREHSAKIIAHIDGYAASAASFIAMAADEIVMNEGGFFMIHKAWTVGWGNANDLMDTAALLEQIDASLVNTYAKRTGQKPEDIAQWMADETWMSAQESVDRGFADRIDTGTKANGSWNMSAYAKAPVIPNESSEAPTSPAADDDPAVASNVEQLRRKLQLVARTA